jgi:glycosyltransferase involved in cell wall biosynthesis
VERDVKLSLVMPVYNEGSTLETVLKQLGKVAMPVPYELIVVDDGSHDGAVDGIQRDWLPNADEVIVVKSIENHGKGSALRKGFSLASGDLLGVQDADLEYDPQQIPTMIEPILAGRTDVVFGTRQFGSHASFSFWYVVGNRLMSLVASALFDRYITDAYTCYKFFTRERYEQLHLTADGFEIEAELTGGLLGNGARIYEIPITYTARSRDDGKKIHPRDGLTGVLRLLRVRARGW